MPVTSVDDLFHVLEKSSLLSREQFQAVRQQLSGESDPKNVARRLLGDGRLTKWQALQLLHGRYALAIGPYQLLDQMAGDNVVRTFLAQHTGSGQKVELRSMSRSHAVQHPEAVEQFVEAAEKTANSENRKLLEVHRPACPDDVCYVALEQAGGSVPAAVAAALSDSVAVVEKPIAEEDQAAEQPSPARESGVGGEKPAQPEAAAPQPAAETRPPKLKAKARPASPAPAPTADDTPSLPADFPAETPSSPADQVTLSWQDELEGIGAPPADFKIATGKRRKKPRVAPAAKSAKPAVSEAAAKGKAEPADKSGRARPSALVLGGIVGGVLLLLVVGVVLAWAFFSGGDESKVAAGAGKDAAKQANDAPKENAPKPDEAASAESQPAPESKPAGDAEAPSPASPDPKSGTSSAKAEGAQPAATPAEEVKSADSSAPAGAKPSAAPEGQAKTSGQEPAAADMTGETAKPDAMTPEPAAEPGSAKPEPAPEAQPAPSEEPAKPAAKEPAAPPPNKKPFADLKDTLALPDVSVDQPTVLGAVYIATGELCFVKLRGGEKACKGKQQFALKNARGGLAEREWEISIREGAAEGETVIASLAVNDNSELVFQWKPEAKTQTIAPFLRNCAINFSSGGEAKAVTLREPTPAEALAVDFDKPAKGDWKIEYCPDPEAVKFEIIGVQGVKCTIEPAGPMEADKATAWVQVQESGGLLSFKVDASLKRDFQLTAATYLKQSPEAPKPDKFMRRSFQDGLKKVEMMSQQAGQTVQNMQQFLKSKAPEGERKQLEQRVPAFELDAKKWETLAQNLKKIDELLKTLEAGMKIQFRVFYDAKSTDGTESTEVTLLKVGS